MNSTKHEDCKVFVELKGVKIFEAGWGDITMSSDEEEIALIYTLLNKYKEHLSGFINGVRHQKNQKIVIKSNL